MAAGTAVKTRYLYGWHRFGWVVANPPARPSAWTSAVLAPEGGPATPTLTLTVTCPYDGIVSVPYGLRAGCYTGSTPPTRVTAAVAKVIRLTELPTGQTVYADPIWSGVIPGAGGNPAQPGSFQFGELSAVVP